MVLTDTDMKEHYATGVKGKEDKWESGLIDNTPLPSVSSAKKASYKKFADSPPKDVWYSRWFDAMKG